MIDKLKNETKNKSDVLVVGKAQSGGSAILRAIEIVDMISRSDHMPRVEEICRAVNLPRATVKRILEKLEHAGFVSKEPGVKRYQCGHRLHSVSIAALQNSPAHDSRHAILEMLVGDLGETCNLTIPDINQISFLDRVEASWTLPVSLGVGTKMPLYASASGKLYLSLMSRRNCERFIRAAPLVGYTDNTLTDPSRLLSELETIRNNDFAFDEEEYLNGIFGVAVPIRNSQGTVIASIATHGSSARISANDAIEFLPHLRDAAENLGRTFDFV